MHETWREALAEPVGATASQWREELEELAWHESDDFRQPRRSRKGVRRIAQPPDGVTLPFCAERSGAGSEVATSFDGRNRPSGTTAGRVEGSNLRRIRNSC